MAGPEGRCTLCQKRFDSRRVSPHRRGYDAEHEKLRIQCFERDHWRCVDCGWEPSVVRDFKEYQLGDPPLQIILDELRTRWHKGERHLHADHDVAIQERADLRLCLDNYRTRCNRCHAAKTMREQQISDMPNGSTRSDEHASDPAAIRVR
jgi:hypothetical protein